MHSHDARVARLGSTPQRAGPLSGDHPRRFSITETFKKPLNSQEGGWTICSTVFSSGYPVATKAHDTRALQAYLVHRNIQHSVRYTELSPTRFKDFWRN